jgi:hypothetical protein
MGKLQKLFIVLVLLAAWLYQYKKKIVKTIDRVSERLGQVEECYEWCDSKGLVINFTKSEKIHCKDKCFKFAYMAPIMELICQIGCKPYDFFGKGSCIRSETCNYYLEVNAVDVTEAVKTRWMQALGNRVFSG